MWIDLESPSRAEEMIVILMETLSADRARQPKMSPPRNALPSKSLMKTSGHAGLVRQVASTVLPTRWGIFQMLGFEREARRSGSEVETAVVLIWAKTWLAALATGDPYECEMRAPTARGSYRWCLSRAVPLRDESGDIVKWCGTNTDLRVEVLADARVRRLYGVSGGSLNGAKMLEPRD
jgi:PAS domain-containing protein